MLNQLRNETRPLVISPAEIHRRNETGESKKGMYHENCNALFVGMQGHSIFFQRFFIVYK